MISLLWLLLRALWAPIGATFGVLRARRRGGRFLVEAIDEERGLFYVQTAQTRPGFVLEGDDETIRIFPGRTRLRTDAPGTEPLPEPAAARTPTNATPRPPREGSFSGWRRLFRRSPRLRPPELRVFPGIAAAIIPAHDEETVIAATLRSVITVFHPADVYVFCDNCSDATAAIARELLPSANVLESPHQMGKSRGLERVLRTVIYPREYAYVSIIDADTTIQPDFLTSALKLLRVVDVACVVGQVKSRWFANNLISVYRTYMYTLWQMVYKRLQSLTNSITIASGCSSTWKTRVLRQLTFDHQMSTEDFSLTIQVHRRRLGKIKYSPSTVVWTQDPFSLASYRKQVYRWDRAWWESVRKYRVGLQWLRFKRGLPVGVSALDISTLMLSFDMLMFMVSVFVLPLMVLRPLHLHLGLFRFETRSAVLLALAWEYGSVLASALIVAIVVRRARVFFYSPLFVFLAYVDIVVGLRAMTSTIRRQYRQVGGATAAAASVWVSPERRGDT